MAHYKSSRPKKAPKTKKVACVICGKKDIEPRMRREPPGHGAWVHPEVCREKKRIQDQE